MSDLTTFRDHCRAMSAADHKPECPWTDARAVAAENLRRARFARMVDEPPRPPIPECSGCVTDVERALFARLAAEVDDYLDPHPTLWEDA
jgi:hypothetical protein